MKARQLWILAGALVVLLGVRAWVDRGPGTAGSLEDAGLSRAIGDGFDAASIRWLRLSGPMDGAALELVRSEEGWRVESAHGAPAEAEEIAAFLKGLESLRGEVRGEGESLLSAFGLDAESAARLELGAERGQAKQVLLLGKSGDSPGSHFLAREGDDRIRHVASGLTQALGLNGESREPDPQHWVRLQVLDLPAEALTGLDVTRPDAAWRLRREAPTSPDGSEPAGAPEWRLEVPELPWPVRSGALGSAASRVSRLRADAVLDPAACAGSALPVRVELTAAPSSHALQVGAALLEGDRVALRVDGGATCYGLSRWTAEALVPRVSRVFDAPKPLELPTGEGDGLTRLELERGGERIRLEKDGEDWKLVRPVRGPADSARVGRVLSALRFLSWDDLAAEPPSRRPPHATWTARAGERRFVLHLLEPREAALDGARLARLEGGEPLPAGFVGVLAGSVVESLLPSLDELKATVDADG